MMLTVYVPGTVPGELDPPQEANPSTKRIVAANNMRFVEGHGFRRTEKNNQRVNAMLSNKSRNVGGSRPGENCGGAALCRVPIVTVALAESTPSRVTEEGFTVQEPAKVNAPQARLTVNVAPFNGVIESVAGID